jgi:hypothetical protein
MVVALLWLVFSPLLLLKILVTREHIPDYGRRLGGGEEES